MEIAFSVAVELLSKDKKQLSKGRKQVSKHTEVLLLAKKLGSKSKFQVSTTVEAIIL
jgi:hypothetical protein